MGSCSLMGKEIENKGITTRGRVKVDSGKEGIWMFASMVRASRIRVRK